MVAQAHTYKYKLNIHEPSDSRWRWVKPLSVSLLFLQFLPCLLLWDEAYIRIHDTLEGIDYQLLFNSGTIFDYSPGTVIEQVMNGQPRMAMKTGWSFVALWHGLFGLYGGYLMNYILVHLTAFGGMLLLLRNHLIPGWQVEPTAFGVALCFSWIPVFSMLGLTVAGQPLLAWAFLNILKNEKKCASLAVVTLFPFYSDIVWAGLPVLLFAAGYWLYDLWKTGRWNWKYFIACGWMAALYIAANWQLFQLTFFTGDFISHRAEYDYFYNKTCTPGQSLKDILQILFISHHHTGIFISVPVMLALGWSRSWLGNDRRSSKLLAVLLGIAIFYGCYNWLVWLGSDYFILLRSFKFERVIVLVPTLWLVLFALALARLIQNRVFGRTLAMLLAAQFLLCVLANDEFVHNCRQLAGQPRKPNFQAFFDPELFPEIDRHIGLPKDGYRVVSLGMHPSVAQYNGFFTLDCHASLYSLDYKHRFRQIMAKELERDEVIRNEFDHFGNRCYLYSAELGKEFDAFLCGKKSARQVENPGYDVDQLCGMGAAYLFSAVEIIDAQRSGLHLSGIFEGKFWKIHLYEIRGNAIVKNELRNR
jgi:hypothetical protein